MLNVSGETSAGKKSASDFVSRDPTGFGGSWGSSETNGANKHQRRGKSMDVLTGSPELDHSSVKLGVLII